MKVSSNLGVDFTATGKNMYLNKSASPITESNPEFTGISDSIEIVGKTAKSEIILPVTTSNIMTLTEKAIPGLQ
jgi:hypothetical protein